MESLEAFIRKRMNQSDHMGMMIPRYLENPNRFMGKKQYTLEDAVNHQKEAKKCDAVLKFLKQYNRENK